MMDINAIIEKIKEVVEDIKEKLDRAMASERDRRALLIGAAGLSAMILYIVFNSFSSNIDKLEKRADMLESQLANVKSLQAEYVESMRKIEELTSGIKKENEALISVAEKIMIGENIDRQNFSIRDVNTRASASVEELYRETSVEVDIKKLTLNGLVDVLYKIQRRPTFLKVSNLRIRSRFDDSDLLDVTFRVSTFEFEKII